MTTVKNKRWTSDGYVYDRIAYMDVKNNGSIFFYKGRNFRGELKPPTMTSYDNYFSVNPDMDSMWMRSRYVPPIYKMTTFLGYQGDVYKSFINPLYLQDVSSVYERYIDEDDNYEITGGNVFKDIPDEFFWFFVESIDIAVQEANYNNKYTMKHSKFMNTIIKGYSQPVLGYRLENTFKGIFSIKNEEEYYFVKDGEEYRIGGLNKHGSMTSQTYRTIINANRRSGDMIGFPQRTGTLSSGLGMLAGIGGELVSIRYTQPFEHSLLGGWGGDFDGNIPLSRGGSLISNVMGVKALYVDRKPESNVISGYNNTPRLDLREVRNLNTMINYRYPKITNVDEGGNEEKNYLLANEEYDKMLKENQAYHVILDFVTFSGGLIYAGFWLQTLKSLGRHAMNVMEEESRKIDAERNFDDSSIPHIEHVRGGDYISIFRNVIPFEYEKDILTPVRNTGGYVSKNKNPYISLPINKLVKSSEELYDLVKEIQDEVGMESTSFNINVKPYMNSGYGDIVNAWSKYLFSSGLNVNLFTINNEDY